MQQQIYAIGDVHGCLDSLQQLLQIINFQPNRDILWFTGDIIGRGKSSLDTLRFIKALPNKIVVLGNHELHTLALPYLPEIQPKFPELVNILQAPDSKELLDWIRNQTLLHHDSKLGYTLVHAGLPPQWDLQFAQKCAHEVEIAIRDPKIYPDFFPHMRANKPDLWDANLHGHDRLIFSINALTRIRFCNSDGELNLTCKGKIGEQPEGYMPWFSAPNRQNKNLRIIFGHWAALTGTIQDPNLFALDTGCVWGNKLTAMNLKTQELFAVKCSV